MIQVTEFAFVGYPVTDLARAREFYEGALNLPARVLWEHGGKGWIEYEVGAHTLAISNVSPQWQPSGQGPSVALEVADFDVALNHLRDRGICFIMEPVTSPVCRMVMVADPDGNKLAIHMRTVPAMIG